MRKAVLLVAATIVLSGCATPPPKISQSGLEVQAYQTRDFEVSKRVAFDATMSVLQDTGFIIESADYETGFITGKGTTNSRSSFWYGLMNESVKMTAFVQQRTSNIASIRINLVETKQRKSVWNNTQDVINEAGVRDPETYQELFTRIGNTVFVKENIN